MQSMVGSAPDLDVAAAHVVLCDIDDRHYWLRRLIDGLWIDLVRMRD